MSATRIVAAVLAVTFFLAAYLTLKSFDMLAAPGLAEAKPLAVGDQEIAWIAPATSGDTWERLVAALRNLEETWPRVHPDLPGLRVEYDRAFLDLTADIPEITLNVGGNVPARLRLRWYKVSREARARAWVEKLSRRPTPPLAVIGGDTSDHALSLGRTLRDFRDHWPGPAPLFLITTATADRYAEGPDPDLTEGTKWPKLMDVYKGRSFRFSFTNTRMAQAVMDFVRNHHEVWIDVNAEPAVLAAVLAGPGAWLNLTGLAANGFLPSYALYTLSWSDDRYSLDLSDRFVKVFTDTFGRSKAEDHPPRIISDKVDYSVGDFYQPNPSEAYAVDRLLPVLTGYRHQLLVLPTGTQPARRFLRTLARRAPLDTRKLVVLTGDSITFNTIYRDRDIAWNILDMPLSLVLFSHRNPIDATAGFRAQADADHPAATTGTQDLLLHRDLMEALIGAAFRNGQLLGNADELHMRLRLARWKRGRIFVGDQADGTAPAGIPFFDDDGDRHSRTGEHIVWLKPRLDRDRTLPRAVITVWRLRSNDPTSGWRQIGPPNYVVLGTSTVGLMGCVLGEGVVAAAGTLLVDRPGEPLLVNYEGGR
jgi:hypothetical protein